MARALIIKALSVRCLSASISSLVSFDRELYSQSSAYMGSKCLLFSKAALISNRMFIISPLCDRVLSGQII